MKNKTTLILFILLGLPLIAFGALRVLGAPNRDWAIGAAILYLIPVVLMLLKKTGLKTTGVWIGVFLVLDFVYSVYIYDHDYKTLPPLMTQKFEIVGDVMPGFSGIETVTTDEMGFRVTRKINYLSKPDNTLRIFAIGASTTEQIYLDDRETWTHLLQEKMQAAYPDKQVEVINTGLSGLRAAHHLSTLKVISNYQPDKVLFLVGLNDWNRQIRLTLTEELAQEDFLRQFSPKLSLIGMAVDGIRAKRRAEKAAKKAKSETGPKQVDGAYYASVNKSFERRANRDFSIDTVSEEYRQDMTAILEYCAGADFDCVFLTQPNGYQEGVEPALKDRFWMTPPKEDYTVGMSAIQKTALTYNNFLTSQAGKYNQRACDLAVGISPTIEFFYDDCHYNEKGAARVAELLSQCLIK